MRSRCDSAGSSMKGKSGMNCSIRLCLPAIVNDERLRVQLAATGQVETGDGAWDWHHGERDYVAPAARVLAHDQCCLAAAFDGVHHLLRQFLAQLLQHFFQKQLHDSQVPAVLLHRCAFCFRLHYFAPFFSFSRTQMVCSWGMLPCFLISIPVRSGSTMMSMPMNLRPLYPPASGTELWMLIQPNSVCTLTESSSVSISRFVFLKNLMAIQNPR